MDDLKLLEQRMLLETVDLMYLYKVITLEEKNVMETRIKVQE